MFMVEYRNGKFIGKDLSSNGINKYVDYRFIGKDVDKDGKKYKVWIKDAGVDVAADVRRLSSDKINAWIVGDKIAKLCSKHRLHDNEYLCKRISDMIIRHFKKNNRGITDRNVNKLIREAVKKEVFGTVHIVDECLIKYGDVYE